MKNDFPHMYVRTLETFNNYDILCTYVAELPITPSLSNTMDLSFLLCSSGMYTVCCVFV